mmetsp:Transcript_10775/g.24112  ORF Transcript_10775/g.24112 Transcript_10775/m.24112 type:complete len:194 (+) Transcript_10775:205-786(+)
MEFTMKSVEETRRNIEMYRVEQERAILRTDPDVIQTRPKLGVGMGGMGGMGGIGGLGSPGGSSVSSVSSVSVSNILNVDCVIMPSSAEPGSHHKLWPQALLHNRPRSAAEVGQLESHGSLWRIVPWPETAPGSRVMLQCSERGEVPRYVGRQLGMVEHKGTRRRHCMCLYRLGMHRSVGNLGTWEPPSTSVCC